LRQNQIRNLTPNTQRVYVAHVLRFACYFRKSPDLLGPAEMRTDLTQERRLAASSIIVTVSALRFFYTVTLKRPHMDTSGAETKVRQAVSRLKGHRSV
jgi:hypothetical protein